MAHLRHIALSVPDPEKTARFYEKSFGMKRIGTLDHDQANRIYLSYGVMNMAVLRYKLDEVVYKDGARITSGCTISASSSTIWSTVIVTPTKLPVYSNSFRK